VQVILVSEQEINYKSPARYSNEYQLMLQRYDDFSIIDLNPANKKTSLCCAKL